MGEFDLPVRNFECPKYLLCLDWAVKKNVKMACELGKCDPSTITFEEPKKEEVRIMSQEKRCSKCEEKKLPEEFSKNVSTSDGLERWCKDCKKKAGQKYRDKQKDSDEGRKNPKKSWKPHFRRLPEDSRKEIDEAILLPADVIKAIKRAVAKDIIKIIQEAFA